MTASPSLARLVFPSLRWRRGSFAHERPKIDAALAAGVGGFIVFGGRRDAVTDLTRELRAQAGRPLLVGADLERGPAQQIEGLTELPPPAALGWLDDLDTTATSGMITGAEARSVGINWAFAPVCDLDLEPRNPIVQTRSFGTDPVRVGEHAAAWIRGLQDHGVQGCAKHYPGHGRTIQDSHETLPVVLTAAHELQRVDGTPFEYAVRAGVGSVMSAFVAYPDWDPSGRAASFSDTILGYLRGTVNFAGLVVTDALIMAGASAAQPVPAATVRAVAAGCDALLYPSDFDSVIKALDAAVGTEIPTARADDALARYDRALSAWGSLPDQGEPDLVDHATFADGIADRAAHLVRGDPPHLNGPVAISIVDDDVGGPYAIPPRDVFHHTLRDAGMSIVRRATGKVQRVVLVYAEPRSWKGRADLGRRSREALRQLVPGAHLVVLFGHPRLAAQITGTVPILMCWHGQGLMQRAAARWVIHSVSSKR
ncbi:MAG TPA: glycoside hydrolase family 3 N-terminal domain-containing protein [Gemmatimonadales bacterium]|nr:glycoside hydrolase family 3 N-terminal domain-containing protein [Gemmatimonadales bacterium]